MKVAFTLCSNNYLAQAKVLGDSLLEYNPDYTFVIGLVDEINKEIDLSPFASFKIIPISTIGISEFDDLWKKYNIIELNTSVKASFIKYLQTTYSEAAHFFYFDPDIAVFHSFSYIENEFTENDILLTPHSLSPLPLDGCLPGENIFLNYGVYNLGFIGLKNNSPVVNSMLDWWEERTLKFGFDDANNGFFVDQLWMNLVPIYYSKVKVLTSMGLNAAPWNLHERKSLSKADGDYLMPDGTKLIFYHFSSYNFKKPGQISKYYNRYSFDDIPVLKDMYNKYQVQLESNNINILSSVSCSYVAKRETFIASIKSENIKKPNNGNTVTFKDFVPPIFKRIYKKLRLN